MAIDALEDWWGTKRLEALRRTSEGRGCFRQRSRRARDRTMVVLWIESLAT